jgi:hypothetical protein
VALLTVFDSSEPGYLAGMSALSTRWIIGLFVVAAVVAVVVILVVSGGGDGGGGGPGY